MIAQIKMEKVGFDLPPVWDFLDCHACTPGDAVGDMELLVHPEAAPSFIEDKLVMFLCSQTTVGGVEFYVWVSPGRGCL